MKALLSVLVAAAFAASSFNAVAQSKDVTTKAGEDAKAKDGTAVKTKEMKDKPKHPAPKIEKKAKKEKPKGAEMKTKEGEAVKTK
jgi:hypothetical protein